MSDENVQQRFRHVQPSRGLLALVSGGRFDPRALPRRLAPVAVLIVVALGAPPTGVRARTSARNVLLLTVDGLGFEETPAVVALRARARVFERAYLPHSASAASRAALFLGRHPESSGIWRDADHRPPRALALPEKFARHGFATACVGQCLGPGLQDDVPWDQKLRASASADTAQQIAAQLEGARTPLFLAASFDDLGPPATLAAPTAAGASGISHPAIALRDLPFAARPGARATLARPDDAARRAALAAQQERARRFDAQLARILSTLDRRHLWETTVVVLVGTQAPALGESGLWPRGDVLSEDLLHVPLLVAAPGLPSPGAATRALTDVTDLFPTVSELAGLKGGHRTDGKSLTPVLQNPSATVRKALASVAHRTAGRLGRSARTARFRYTEWPDGSRELYDHDADPHEYTNLATREEHAATVRQMKALLDPHPRPTASRPRRDAGRHPNVLMIVLDDATMHMGTYGYPVHTPNLDRLAQRGRRFDGAYVPVAMCSPSRTAILSGWQPLRTGVWDNTTEPRRPGMVPVEEYFHAHGYFTAEVGKVWETRFARRFKWDLSEYDPPAPPSAGGSAATPRPRAPAAEEPEDLRDHRRQLHGGGGDDLSKLWRMTDGEDENEPDGRRARRVAQLLAEKRERPFFIALGFAKPHLRWITPRRYFELYDPHTIDLPQNPADDCDDIPEIALRDEVSRPGRFFVGREDTIDAESRREAKRAYYATVSFVDAQLGLVLDALDGGGLWDDTIVVLFSDHGFHLSEHRSDMWRKDTLFEEAVHVPLILAAPGLVRAGTPAAAPVELLDLYPTLTELAGLPSPRGLDGVSLAPLLADPGASVRSAALSWRRVGTPVLGVSVRTDRWRYTQWPDGSEELFDLESRSTEGQDLAAAPAAAKTLAELRALSLELVP